MIGKLIKIGCGVGSALMLFVCICLSLITIPNCGGQITNTFQDDQVNDTDPEPPPDGEATCDNAGVSYPDNPFSGWPMNRSWGDVNYYYCAANYYQEFGRTHWGIDINAHHREPVYATANSTVVRAYYDTVYGMGRNVKICTNSGWCAIYMHLDEWVVSAGDNVNRGDLLGYTDNTGFSTGTHLHYQINNPAGSPVDPAPTFN